MKYIIQLEDEKIAAWLIKDDDYILEENEIEVQEEEFISAMNRDANCYEKVTQTFKIKDFESLEEKIAIKVFILKNNTNYEAPTLCLNIPWVGGYDSAQMLNAKRTLCLEMGLESCAFTDAQDVDHILTLSQAKEVCISVAAEFEARREIYKMKKRTIELCTTIEELEAIEI